MKDKGKKLLLISSILEIVMGSIYAIGAIAIIVMAMLGTIQDKLKTMAVLDQYSEAEVNMVIKILIIFTVIIVALFTFILLTFGIKSVKYTKLDSNAYVGKMTSVKRYAITFTVFAVLMILSLFETSTSELLSVIISIVIWAVLATLNFIVMKDMNDIKNGKQQATIPTEKK